MTYSRESVRLSIRVAMVVLSLATVFWTAPAQGQRVLNTERVDPRTVSGLFTRVETGIDLRGGNSDILSLKGSGIVGYHGTHSWVLLMGGLSYLSSNDSVSSDDEYMQARYGWIFSPRTRTFHFVQIQKSRAQALSRRVLLGSGLRHAFALSERNRLDLGVGVMWESELLNAARLPAGTSTHSHDWRGDLIGVASHKLSSTATFSDVLYVEPRVDAPADIRVLNEATLAVKVVQGVDLNVSFHWLHDSRPPPSIGRDDVEFITSISATVR